MSKEDVINYVMTTPNNPNRAVLEGMLDGMAQGGGTVEVIKLGTIQGGSYEHVASGGGALNGTFEEVIGNRSVVNVVAKKEGNSSIVLLKFLLKQDDVFYDLIRDQNTEEIKTARQYVASAWIESADAGSYSFDVYAVCISKE